MTKAHLRIYKVAKVIDLKGDVAAAVSALTDIELMPDADAEPEDRYEAMIFLPTFTIRNGVFASQLIACQRLGNSLSMCVMSS